MFSMTTYSGRDFYPFDIHEEVFIIEDIAHSLAFQCRFGGHCSRFYSIAQHCIYCSWLVAEEFKLSALMHDAGEAYVSDVPTPIKMALPTFKKIEDNTMTMIANKFGFSWPSPKVVDDADKDLLFWEMYHLFPAKKIDPDYLTVEFDYEYWSPEKAEQEFIKHFNGLWRP